MTCASVGVLLRLGRLMVSPGRGLDGDGSDCARAGANFTVRIPIEHPCRWAERRKATNPTHDSCARQPKTLPASYVGFKSMLCRSPGLAR